MTMYILELNDSGARVSSDTGTIAVSPAYAVLLDDTLYTGSEAQRLARLHPRQTYNRFWANLSQDAPLAVPTHRFRHHADIAYEHLKSLHEQAGKPAEMILAVPGSFSREQLSLLLGIAQALPFKASGLVDSAVAAAASITGRGRYQHIELLLHQTLLTRIDVAETVVRTAVDTLDNGGISAIHDVAASLISDLFIQHCRFDPLHHAETEQILYNQIPVCLQSLANQSEVPVEINYRAVRNQVKLSRVSLLERLEPLYQNILQRLDPTRKTLLSDRIAALPGLAGLIAGATSLDSDCLFSGCEQHSAAILSTGPQLNFVTSLPLPVNPGLQAAMPVSNTPSETLSRQSMAATHMLIGHRIYPLQQSPVYLSTRGSVHMTRQEASACSIALNSYHVVITPISDIRMYVNGEHLSGARTLYAGDRLSFAGFDTVCSLVMLVNSDAT